MIKRFQDTDGRRRLIETLLKCSLIKNDKALAEKLADLGELAAIESGEILITQGADDNDIYFILSGEIDVSINGRHVAIRKAPDEVGEMAILNPSEPRSATLTAITNVVVLRVSEPDFTQLADEHLHIWKSVAFIVSSRLRERSTYFNVPNENPVLFIGCSAESVKIAEEIQLKLKFSNINVEIWTDGIFGPSGITIDDLLITVGNSDFAAFLFTPDDTVISRGNESDAPRDNTVFELGLFMGKLNRERTFIIHQHKADIKIPTDLLGVTPITYNLKSGSDISSAVTTVCTELRKAIEKLGAR
jgi:CRP/FNR family transcriptional regulator, cyclic AMP receptor protein